MNVYIGADHRGFALKNHLVHWLKRQGYTVEDCGNTVYDAQDDYPDFVKNVIHHMRASSNQQLSINNSPLGLLICGSGVGVAIGANRYKGIYCGLGFDADQVSHARKNDHINVLALPADYLSEKQAEDITAAFLSGQPIAQEKYLRRLKKIDQ